MNTTKTKEVLLKEHENTTRTDYLIKDRQTLQRLMDGCYKEGLIEEAHQYEGAIAELDRKFGVDKPMARMPAPIVKLDLGKREIVQVVQ
jgi:hypothetical protein